MTMKDAEMTKSPLWDSVIHADHVHWCDLELNSLATCVVRAHHEHAIVWAADTLSFATVLILLFLLLRPLARALTRGDGSEITIRIPVRRFVRTAPATGLR
ncbi:hypothetical protein [Croceicoccus marinus]|uniref:Uncharacterized protein n=1 Tax=Croceicoccus marinus TaxID=450378 RepID=A0A7G6W146_9SPHN|nr:hypothetical protein [Croceicoccus marinus]QNE07711.1 hypothetical protein H4O24_20005 [Croceicoccus marinus]